MLEGQTFSVFLLQIIGSTSYTECFRRNSKYFRRW